MPYKFGAEVFTQRNFNRLPPSEVRFYKENCHFGFFGPLWGLGAMYDVHLRLIEKRVVDF